MEFNIMSSQATQAINTLSVLNTSEETKAAIVLAIALKVTSKADFQVISKKVDDYARELSSLTNDADWLKLVGSLGSKETKHTKQDNSKLIDACRSKISLAKSEITKLETTIARMTPFKKDTSSLQLMKLNQESTITENQSEIKKLESEKPFDKVSYDTYTKARFNQVSRLIDFVITSLDSQENSDFMTSLYMPLVVELGELGDDSLLASYDWLASDKLDSDLSDLAASQILGVAFDKYITKRAKGGKVAIADGVTDPKLKQAIIDSRV